MVLQEILEGLVAKGEPFVIQENGTDWRAADLLEKLTPVRLKTAAYLQPGMYIAEINPSGYLGRVLYRLKVPPAES